MKKTIAASLAIATIAGSLVSVAPARAHDGVAAGLAAGLIGGAIVGGAIASSPRPYYGPGPAYYDAPPPPPEGCYYRRERFWDGYEWRFRPVRVCY
jgi:hypothetical protein